MAKTKIKKVVPGKARIARVNKIANVYSYEYTEKENENADSTDKKSN